MALSTLVNTKWLINSSPNWAPFSSTDYDYTNITFTSNNQTYNNLYFEMTSNNKVSLIECGDDSIYYELIGWVNKAYRIISFTQGTDLVDSELISWFEANAIQITHDVEISYKNSIITSTNSSGTTTLNTAGTYCEDDIEVVYTKPGGSINLQSKTITPSGATQTITADSEYDGLDTVTVNPITLKMGVLLPAAELVQTYSYDKYIHADESVTIPAYTTTATTLKASASLTPTVSLNLTNYDYYVLERFLTIPTYNTTTKQKGRPVYQIYSMAYEIISESGGTFKDGNTSYTSRITTVTTAGGTGRCIYWSSGTAVTAVNTNSQGVYQTATAPSISSASSNTPTLTLKTPALQIRGSTTYFTSAVWSTLTDVRYQYKIEVYRIPKSTYNLDGWGLSTQLDKIIECADSNSHTLT